MSKPEDQVLTASNFAQQLGVTEPTPTKTVIAPATTPVETPLFDPPPVTIEEETPEEPTKPAEPTPAPAPEVTPERLLPQSEVNALVGERLARDARRKAMLELEALSGKSAAQLVEDYRQKEVAAFADQTGLTEAEAKEHLEAKEKVRRYEAEQQVLVQEQEALKRHTAYLAGKAKYANHPDAQPLSAAVDAFTQHGNMLPYADGLFHAFGKYWFEGGGREKILDLHRQEVLSSQAKRSEARTEGGAQATKVTEPRLVGAEKAMAHLLLGDVTDQPEAVYAQAKRHRARGS